HRYSLRQCGCRVGGSLASSSDDPSISGHRPAGAVAKPPDMKQCGQVLTFFALAVPVVLLPVAAYAVDATIIASREAGLQAATAEAAEAAAQQLDVGSIRSTGELTLNTAAALVVIHQALAA